MKHINLVVALCALVFCAGSVKADETVKFDQLRNAYDSFMNSHFRRPEKEPGFVLEHEPVITVMITGEFAPEIQLTLYEDDNAVVVKITRAVGASVYEQLYERHRKPLTKNRGGAHNDVALQKAEISSLRCPELLQFYQAFKSIKVSPFVDSTFFHPSVTYQVWVTGLLEENYFKLIGPSTQTEGVAYWGTLESIHADLLGWIHGLVSVLQVLPAQAAQQPGSPRKASKGCRLSVD